jgi:hypothetical protein
MVPVAKTVGSATRLRGGKNGGFFTRTDRTRNGTRRNLTEAWEILQHFPTQLSEKRTGAWEIHTGSGRNRTAKRRTRPLFEVASTSRFVIMGFQKRHTTSKLILQIQLHICWAITTSGFLFWWLVKNHFCHQNQRSSALSHVSSPSPLHPHSALH